MKSRCPSSSLLPPLLFLFLLSLSTACSTNKRVVVLVDGERRVIETLAPTVGDLLREQQIVLGDQDRVEPPDYTPIERTATVQIIRVALKTETTRAPIEFERLYTREENLPEGQVRVSKLGANGEAEIDYQVTLEDGREVSRREIARRVLRAPVNELLLIGTQGAVAPVNITGTLAYIGKGNAWIVRGSTADRRPLTTSGDLDGRVFDLSPDGKYLLFSRAVVGADGPALNTLWVVDTVPFNAEPRRVPVDNALYGQWAPDGSARVAYTRGEKTGGAPGWKAYSDLNIATLYGITETLKISDTDIQTKTIIITPTPRPSDTPPPPQRLSIRVSRPTPQFRPRCPYRPIHPAPLASPSRARYILRARASRQFPRRQKHPSRSPIRSSFRAAPPRRTAGGVGIWHGRPMPKPLPMRLPTASG